MEQIKTEKQRVLWLDILRGFGILGVIAAHASPPRPMYRLICGYTLPLFFMLSGYLWKAKPIRAYWKRLMVPYFILGAINLALDSAMLFLAHEENPIGKYVIGILYSRGTREWMPNCSPLWAISSFFCAMVVFELIQKLPKEPLKLVAVIAAGAVSGLLAYFEVFKLPWNLDAALMGVIFVYAGHLLRKPDGLAKLRKLPPWKLVPLFLLLLIAGLCSVFGNPAEHVSFDNNRYGNVFLMLSGGLTISFVLFGLFDRIPWKGPIAKLLSWLGRHTVFIMGFDFFLGTVVRNVLEAVGLNHWALMFGIKTVILTVGCLAWTWCIGKIKNKSLRQALSF